MGVSREQVSVQEKEELDNLEMPVSSELPLTKDPRAEAGGPLSGAVGASPVLDKVLRSLLTVSVSHSYKVSGSAGHAVELQRQDKGLWAGVGRLCGGPAALMPGLEGG